VIGDAAPVAQGAGSPKQEQDGALLDVRDLRTYFKTDDGIVTAVDGVSFSLGRGETLGIVGESGCGKSVTMMSILGLNPKPGRVHLQAGANVDAEMRRALTGSLKFTSLSTGNAHFNGEDLLTVSPQRLRDIRGAEIAMIFQDPMTSLNPVHKIGAQLMEAVLLHQDVTRQEARDLALDALKSVGIPRFEQRIDDYPHQFSGGMRQRVMIAMALINDPELLIADEPTTALDVTTQAQILELMEALQEEHGTAIIMITHDLGVVAEVADEVVVMYAARVAERAPVDRIYETPMHPYTWGLLGSLPRLEADVERLAQIPGQPPSLLRPPHGCRFHPRCAYAFDRCPVQLPELVASQADPDHLDACLLDEPFKLNEARRIVASFSEEVA
jgi:oligopeptide/dipeptide ABC transporter ATP-binding protein